MKTISLASILIAAAGCMALTACSETADTSASMTPSMAMRTGSPTDENACLSVVAAQTGSSGVVTSSEFSQANTVVMIGVGPQRAPWRCLVSNGVVAEAMSMADEGAL